MTIFELKTNKKRKITFPTEIYNEMVGQAGKYFVFQGRNNNLKKRTRQAVFKDLKKITKIYNLKLNIAPHSCRKIFAVENYKKYRDLNRIKKLLNHESEAVTMLYTLADEITNQKRNKK
jgi:site-specific recombinase XerD